MRLIWSNASDNCRPLRKDLHPEVVFLVDHDGERLVGANGDGARLVVGSRWRAAG